MKENIGLTLNLGALLVYFIVLIFGVTWYYVWPFVITIQIIGIVLQSKGI